MRFTRKLPPQITEKPKTREPLAEGIVPLSPSGKRKWSAMSDRWIIEFTKKFMSDNGITGRKGLKISDGSVYAVLRKRGLLDALDFVKKPKSRRYWSRMSDDELIAFAQRFVERGEIACVGELKKADNGLLVVLRKRKLIGKVKFKKNERAWSRYSDDELVAFAQKFVDEEQIKNKEGLGRADCGLRSALKTRKLVDKVEFSCGARSWKKYSDDELVVYAQKFVDEEKIGSSWGLSKVDAGLHGTLKNRGLLDKVKFKVPERSWRYYSDEELVAYARKFFDRNKIKRRKELLGTDRGLYSTLIKRKLIDRVFSTIEREQEAQGMQEISEAMGEFGGEE